MTQNRRRIVIAGGMLAILGGLIYAVLPATWHYRLFHDATSLHRVLSQTEPGTSVGELERLLGPAQRETDGELSKSIDGYKRMADKNPAGFPDGVSDRDGFIHFPIPEDNTAMRLQVRDERLVNFDPRDFDKPYEPVRVLNSVD